MTASFLKTMILTQQDFYTIVTFLFSGFWYGKAITLQLVSVQSALQSTSNGIHGTIVLFVQTKVFTVSSSACCLEQLHPLRISSYAPVQGKHLAFVPA